MRVAQVFAAASLLFGCQSVLGFEPFVRDRIVADAGDERQENGAPERAEAGLAPVSGGSGGVRGGGSGGADVAAGGGSTGSAARGAGGRAPSIGGSGANEGVGRGGVGGTTASGGNASTGGAGAADSGCNPYCTGGETWLDAVNCDHFGAQRCEHDTSQCNPQRGTCFHLDIDLTEVTMQDYLAWVATNPDWTNRPEACAWKGAGFAPDAHCLAMGGSDVPCVLSPPPPCDAATGCIPDATPPCAKSKLPVVCVDWCDAFAYCAARGRHLCGSISGGSVPSVLASEPGESQWMNACSAGGQFLYGSGGDSPELGGCSYAGTQTLYDVGTSASCRSPSPGYAGLQDMSGNAAEWEDACDPVNQSAPGKDDPCVIRGGSYLSEREALECRQIGKIPRNDTRYDVGFRCCGD